MAQAFKEWQVVCEALASGRQSVILRKGGIHEGKEGFSFAHQSFFLFPTKFHAQLDQVREGEFTPEKEWEVGDAIEITHHAEALFAMSLEDWQQIEDLEPYHIYSEQTIKDRYDWSGKGMSSGSIRMAFVKVCKLKEPWALTYERRFGGCRSWFELPEPPAGVLDSAQPVIAPPEFSVLRKEILSVIG